MNRIGMGHECGYNCMAGLMVRGYFFLLLTENVRTPFRAEHYFFYRLQNIFLSYLVLILSGGQKGAFIYEVCQIGTRETGSSLGYNFHINTACQRFIQRMYL